MRERIVVSYFKCDSPQGDELYRETKRKLELEGVQGLDVEVVLRENDTLVGRDAFMCDDVVIFDASLEGGKAGRQYDALMEVMLYSEYVLIVSRTILPFNVSGTWKGGYPRYLRAGVADYRESLTNRDILLWLKGVFGRMALPNPSKVSRDEFYKLSVEDRLKALTARSRADYAAEGRGYKQRLCAFVSYCSKYSLNFKERNHQKDGYTVEDLIQFISTTQDIPKDEIGYFPPGKLSLELMTLQRRWEVVSETFKLIFACRQFWILDAPGYWESWWTLSERVTLSYILTVLPQYCPHIYVARFDPEWGSFQVKAYLSQEEKRQLLPRLSKRALRTIRLYFANSRSSSIGYVRNPEYRKLMARSFFDFLPGPGEWSDEYSMTIPETLELFRPYWGCRPDSDDFWDTFILECPTCKQKSRHSRYSEESFLYPLRNQFYHVVRKEDVQYKPGERAFCYECPSCKRSFYFLPESYYRWYPMGMESILDLPDAKLVEKKDIFVFRMSGGK